MTSKSRIIANSGRYVNTDGTPKLGGNITLTTIDGQVSASIERDSTEASVINYSSIDSLPISNLITGTIAFVEDINAIYVTDGSGWFSIATVNQSPTVSSGVGSAFDLAIDGTPTIITITASDPEGIPLTYTATPDSDFAGLATLSQDSSVFTITPLSEDSATTTSASVTFAVSDGVNVAGGVNTFTLLFISPYWSDVVLNLGTSDTNGLQNDTFVDKSGNSIPITKYNTPYQTSFHPYLDNWSVEFNMTNAGQRLNAGSHNFNGPFTVEFWYNSTRSGKNCIFNAGLAIGTDDISYILLTISDTQAIWVIRNGADNPNVQTIPIALHDGLWHHIAVLRDTNNNMRTFIDGIEKTDDPRNTSINLGTIPVTIGSFDYGVGGATANDSWLIGNVSNFRIVNSAVYTSNFTPSDEPLTAIAGTSLLTCQSNRFIDNSGNNAVVSPNSSVIRISALNPFGQDAEFISGENKGSGYFSTNEYLRADTALDGFTSVTDPYTLEFWVYPTTQSDVVSNSFMIGINSAASGTNQLLIGLTRMFISETETLYPSNINLFEWSHVALVHSGSNSTKLYVNGNLRATANSNIGVLANCVFGIAAEFDAANGGTPGNYYDGYISDLSVTAGQKYTANFTVSIAPVDPTGAAFYLPFDNVGIFDTTGNNTLEIFGNAQTSSAQTKFASTSISFDGTGDYITIPANENFDPIGVDFTIEAWVYNATSDNSESKVISTNRNGSVGGFYFVIAADNQLVITGWSSSGARIILSGGTVPRNSWNHVAAVKIGETWSIYINGNSVDSGNQTSDFANGLDLYIGRTSTNSSRDFDGYIENFQILKGVAKYLANFTPPAQTQGLVYQATGFPLNTEGTAVTDLSAFEATSPQAGWYYIQPTGAASAALVEYSGIDFKSSGKGYFRWWRSVDTLAPTINHYGLSWQFDEMLVDLESVEYQDVIFNSAQTFNQRDSTAVADGGSRAGYRVFFGYAGGHGIYNTSQSPCFWSVSTGAIGAGYDGNCGSFPNNLRMGTGTSSANYANRGNTISFWFRW